MTAGTQLMHKAGDEYLVHNLQKELKAAEVFIKSGLLPKAIDTPEKVLVISDMARALKIPRVQALSSMSVINGKAAPEAQLMRSLVFRAFPDARFEIKKLTNDECIVSAARPGGKLQDFSFSMDDARTAGLATKEVWRKYPKDLLLARATSKACRFLFPDVLFGMVYTPEEMGQNSVQLDTGEVIDMGGVQNLNEPDKTPDGSSDAPTADDPDIIDTEAEDVDGDSPEENPQADTGPEPEDISDAQKKQLTRFEKSHIASQKERDGIADVLHSRDRAKANKVITHMFRKEAIFKWWEEREVGFRMLKEDFAGVAKKDIRATVKEDAAEKYSELSMRELEKEIGVSVKVDADGKFVVAAK